MKLKSITAVVLFLFTVSVFSQKKTNFADTIILKTSGSVPIEIVFNKGTSFNHPTMAIWLEDMEENYIATLFVTRSFATGIFGYGEGEGGFWKREPGPAQRCAALPYWFHKYKSATGFTGLPNPSNQLPDAISGATPKKDFVMKAFLPDGKKKLRLLMEINQTWDWNEYWTNSSYPDDKNYKTSAQPALVYAATIDLSSPLTEIYLNPIGHSSFNGSDGLLYTNLETLTTAKNIARSIMLKIIKK